MTTPKTVPAPLRLVLHLEGPRWNAYVAPADTMDGAILIGQVSFGIVAQHPDLKDRFQRLMMDAMEVILRDLGVKITGEWDLRQAAAHEKAGRA